MKSHFQQQLAGLQVAHQALGSFAALTIVGILVAHAPAYAQPLITNVQVSAITYSTVRITWNTSTPSSTVIRYGRTNACEMTGTGPPQQTSHAWYVSGLSPETLYYYRVCSADTVELCSGLSTFTTARAVSNHPLPPQPPTSSADVSVPPTDGLKFFVALDCSDLQAKINAAALADGRLTHEVLIPPGALCNGQYTLPAKAGPNAPGTGVIIIRPAISDHKLPPPGVRITPDYKPLMPTIRSNYVAVQSASSAAPPKGCILGDFYWARDATSFKLFKCTDTRGPIWTPIPAAASGPVVPATCSPGDWFYKTGSLDHSSAAWWCLEQNTYVNVRFGTNSSFNNYAAIRVQPGAHHYRLMGLQITHLPTPLPYAAQFNAAPSVQLGSFSWCLAAVLPDTHHVVFDRIHFYGHGYPSRLRSAVCQFEGSYQAIVDSSFSNINSWVHPSSGEVHSSAIRVQEGPGPGRIHNNYFGDVVGITVFFHDDAGTTGIVPADYAITRNHFFLSDRYNHDHPSSDGHYYFRRHHLELKRGRRFLVEGNVFEGGFTTVNQGASICLTPRTGAGNLANNDVGISDIAVKRNIFKNSPQAFIIMGHTDVGSTQTRAFQRLLIEDNLAVGLSESRIGWPRSISARAKFVVAGHGLEDIIIRRNTVYKASATYFPDFVKDPYVSKNAGLEMRDNIYTQVSGAPGWTGVGFRWDTVEGTVALDKGWAGYAVTGNVFQRVTGDPGRYPPGNYFPRSDADIGFVNACVGDFRLASSSPFKGAASDGRDIGADIDALVSAVGGSSGSMRVEGSEICVSPGPPALPAAPEGPSPATAATSVPLTPTLTWRPSAGALSYVVYFGTSSSPPRVGETSGSSYGPGALSAGSMYHWRVEAVNRAGTSSSATWSFSTTGCTYSISPTAQSFGGTAGSGTATVTASPGCAWAAVSDVAWISIASPAGGNGVGVGSVTYNVQANTGAARSGTLTIAGRGLTVNQQGANSRPSVVSVTPSSGSATSQTFSFQFSDPDGAADLRHVYALINSDLRPNQGCMLCYDRSAVWLANDGVTAWIPLALGSAGTIENSQCSVSGSGTSVSSSGTSLTLRVALTFKAAFGGLKTLHLYAIDAAGHHTGWQAGGTWTIGGNQPPSAISVDPATGSGTSRTFTLTFSDPDGAGDIGQTYLLMNSALAGSQGCMICYDGSFLWLATDPGTAWLGVKPGTAASIGNSQCGLNAGGSSAVVAGGTLTVRLALDLKVAFAGAKSIYLYAIDRANHHTGWQLRGTWLVP